MVAFLIPYVMRPANAAFTSGLARKAPSTATESMVARASSGVTSSAILASPSTFICSFSPADSQLPGPGVYNDEIPALGSCAPP